MGYPIKATFIDEVTYDIPASNWSFSQWAKDFDNMKDVGIDTLVIMRGVFYDKCLYPSKYFNTLKKENEDFIGFVLKEADKRNMKVYIGLYISNLCWNDGDFKGEIEQNKIYIKEILERYGNIPSFVGWYIPHETGSDTYNIKYTMEGLISLCKEKSPEKKIFISPFFRSKQIGYENSLTPEETAKCWDYLWENCGKDIDVCAFQDGTCTLAEYTSYFSAVKKVCDKYNISLWANVETFERDVRAMFFPIPFDILRKKIELATPIVDNMITFEFSHFLSPQSIFPSGRNLNALYCDYYGKNK